jgi:hypothetical protein
VNDFYSLRLLAAAHEQSLEQEAAEFRLAKRYGNSLLADVERLVGTVALLGALAVVSWIYPI